VRMRLATRTRRADFMSDSVRSAVDQPPVKSLDDVRIDRTKQLKVGQSPSMSTAGVVKDALEGHYGSLKAAACSMTPPMDLGQLSRELKSGDFKLEKLDRLDDDGKSAVARAFREAYDDRDPKSEARRLIREARQRLDALAEVVA
jgi:hypothetical protein